MAGHMTLEEYRTLENASFPVAIGEGKVHSLDLVSDCCDHQIVDIRLKVKMLNKSTAQIIMGGHCGSCGGFDSGKLRWYLEEGDIHDFREEGISRINLTPKGPLNKAKHLCNKVKSFAKSLTLSE